MISTWWRKCRVQRDSWAGYEVQWWYVWFPVWLQYSSNTHATYEAAMRYAEEHIKLKKPI